MILMLEKVISVINDPKFPNDRKKMIAQTRKVAVHVESGTQIYERAPSVIDEAQSQGEQIMKKTMNESAKTVIQLGNGQVIHVLQTMEEVIAQVEGKKAK